MTHEAKPNANANANVKPKPDGYHTATAYLIVSDAARALAFYQQAFGAEELLRLEMPGGNGIAHAEFKVGDSPIMLADEQPEMGHRSPTTIGGTPVAMMLYVDDCDAVFQRAIDAGASVMKPVDNQFYGDRSGMLVDPFGHVWTIATHVEDVAQDEVERRFAEMMKHSQA